MRTVFLLSLVFSSLALCANPGDVVKKRFDSENYRVTWGSVPSFANNSILEIGEGNGHGGTLSWVRFKPAKDTVEVLSLVFDKGWSPYKSKWEPDLAPVKIKKGSMKPADYASLLSDLAIIASATLVQNEAGLGHSTIDIWVSARLLVDNKAILDEDWAGYQADKHEAAYAKPSVAVDLANKKTEMIKFVEHNLTEEERIWASLKFSSDMKRYDKKAPYSWVRSRCIVIIGAVGDATALPALRKILEDNSDGVYYAINAATRLIGKDVRDKPVEEMDIEKNRLKVLDQIRLKK